ncbi:ABC transporter permease [Actinomadura sp. SCN-SB]|uniref:ABC transporter permease n=1 Tax=Actinomadura sp. SCN-SB TaxID=3373092 RepID=UPI0037522C47
MLWFGVKRLARGLLVVLFVSFLVVALLGLAPGSPATVILGENASPQAVAELEQRLGLDQPVWTQWWDWILAASQGDLGTSLVTGVAVLKAVVTALPVTLEIAVLALLISLLVSMPLALLAAPRAGSAVDRGVSALTSVLLAIPAFVAAPLLVYLFAIQLRWFPVTGWVPLSEGIGANLRSAFLPALSVALIEIAAFQRVLRADLVTTLREDYIDAARTKGLTARYVLMRHALRPSSFSLLTVSGVSLGRLLGGTVIVEYLFTLPGLGQLVATGVSSRDVVTVQGVVAFVAMAYVLVNTLVDIGYGFLDPRIRLAGAR